MHGDHDLAELRLFPVRRKQSENGLLERRVEIFLAQEGVGRELGMPLPFHREGAEIGGEMLHVGGGLGGAELAAERDQILEIPVAAMLAGAETDMADAERRPHRPDRPCVQLQGQRVPFGMKFHSSAPFT